MKRSIRSKLFAFMAGLMAVVIVFGWLINSLFLERFYLFSKTGTLIQAFEGINTLYKTQEADTNLELEFEKLQSNRGMGLVVFDNQMNVLYYTWKNAVIIGDRRMLIPGISGIEKYIRQPENRPRYLVQQNYEERLDAEYLDLLGTLDNGLFVLLRTPLQSITESVDIANKFLLFTGMISIIFSAFISARISAQIARPIKEVESIARDMAKLDFSHRIQVSEEDEIGSLASSFNALSDKLERTISELRDTNQQLEEDILYISGLDDKRREFLSSVSHELKTPIALIQGYAEALQDNVITSEEDRRYYLDVIGDEANRMNQLVRKLTTINSLESGHDDLTLDSIELVSMVKSLMRRTKNLPGAEGVSFAYEGPEEAWAYGDEFLIDEVIANYLTNAIHYAEGRRLVRVRVKLLADDARREDMVSRAAKALAGGTAASVGQAMEKARQARVRVEVFNSGRQLDQEESQRIWESFYKADKSRCREYGGSGLGLTIVKTVMERHKANYGVENLEDGVSFWFELPQSSGEQDPGEQGAGGPRQDVGESGKNEEVEPRA